jgi:hypothetical protein
MVGAPLQAAAGQATAVELQTDSAFQRLEWILTSQVFSNIPGIKGKTFIAIRRIARNPDENAG